MSIRFEQADRDKMTPDDEICIGAQLFNFTHQVEARFGLPGVRLIKRWCLEKLPFRAFERGYFEKETK